MPLQFFSQDIQSLPFDEGLLSYLPEKKISALALVSFEWQNKIPTIPVHPLKAAHFNTLVCHGKQNVADNLLSHALPSRRQQFLLMPATFSDYSGRTFTCTAYEYAWWAKDTHMRRMLEKYMDDETKAKVLGRIEVITKIGLTYQQNGETKNSIHFDFSPLIDALQTYANGYNEWRDNHNWDAMKSAWINGVGEAQRDVVVHVANEYCRKDRSFSPTPQFDEERLPRELSFHSCDTIKAGSWFPLKTDALGYSYAIYRSPELARAGLGWAAYMQAGIEVDLAAIRQLDLVRTLELSTSLEVLKGEALSSSIGM